MKVQVQRLPHGRDLSLSVEVEAVRDKHVPVAGDPVKDVTSAGACHAEYGNAGAGIDQDSEIVLRDECHRAVIGQIDSIHPESIRPHRSNVTGVTVEDIKG